MWNSIKEGNLVVISVWQCISYLGEVIENNDEEIVLNNVEVYKLGDSTEIYKTDEVTIDKADIELLAPVRAMSVEERIK